MPSLRTFNLRVTVPCDFSLLIFFVRYLKREKRDDYSENPYLHHSMPSLRSILFSMLAFENSPAVNVARTMQKPGQWYFST